MRSIRNSFCIAFSMYSKIPVPRPEWTEENRRYVLSFFPLVGLAVAGAELLWLFASGLIFPWSIRAAVAIAIPLFVTGGIHFDGFLDVCDARASWRDRKEKLRILKDPHVGAFAVIGAAVYFLIAFGFADRVEYSLPVLLLSFPLSRACSSLFVLCLPNTNSAGTAAGFVPENRWLVNVIVNIAYISVIVFIYLQYSLLIGGLALLGLGFAVLYLLYLTRRVFGGINGDIAGHFVCMAELLMLVGAVTGEILQKTVEVFSGTQECLPIWNWL